MSASDLHLSFAGYTIVRVPPEGGSSGAEPLYLVRRPDGSACCDAVSWAQVEAVVNRDQADRHSDGRGSN